MDRPRSLDDESLNARIGLLKAVLGGTIAFGASLVLFPDAAQTAFNLMIYGQRNHPIDFSPEAIRYLKLNVNVFGASIFGWFIALYYIADGPLR